MTTSERAAPAAIVLVHGGFMGSWCWTRVVDRLAGAGVKMFAPTLAGLGDRADELGPGVDLYTHIDEIADLIVREDLRDIVLCGHSYAGMVISGVAGRVGDRIHTLVYLDAILPEPGKALWDYLSQSARDAFDAATIGHGIVPARASLAAVNAIDAEWVDTLTTPQPRATLLQPLPQPQVDDAVRDRLYVFATRYGSPMLRRCADGIANVPGWTRFDLPYGHNVMLDAPGAVSAILLQAAIAAAAPVPVPANG